jgi:hypothetical protein
MTDVFFGGRPQAVEEIQAPGTQHEIGDRDRVSVGAILNGGVSCGAGRRDELPSAQPIGSATRIKIAMVRSHFIVSPPSAQAAPMVNPLAVVAQESSQLKSLSIDKSPFDSDVIAIPKLPETIHI